MITDEAGDEAAVRRRMGRIEHRQLRRGVVQGEQVAVGLAGQPRGRLRECGLAARAERAAFRHTERHRRVAPPRLDLNPVSHACGKRRLEAEHGDETPDGPDGGGIRAVGGRHLERIEGCEECVVGHREGCGRRHLEHDLRERRGPRETADVGGQVAAQVHEIEGSERVELAGLAEVELGHALAQELEPCPEAALGSQRPLGDRTLDAKLSRGQAHDLRRFAVAIRLQDEGGRRDEGHGYGFVATAAYVGQCSP